MLYPVAGAQNLPTGPQGRARSGIAPGLDPGVRQFESDCPDVGAEIDAAL